MEVQLHNDGGLPGQLDEFCRVDIPLHSPGLWNIRQAQGFLSFSLPRLQLQLALIFLFTQCLHLLLKRIFLPRMVSEIMVGIILGKTFMGRVLPNITDTLFPEEGEVFLEVLSKIGFAFFMFLVGVKISVTTMFKTGRKSWLLGTSAALCPMIVSIGMFNRFDYTLPVYRRPATKSVTGVQTLTPFPVVASLLIDLKIMNSELGRLALASTLISDFIGTTFSLVQTTMRLSYEGWLYLMWINSLVLILGLIVVIAFIMRPFSLWIIKNTPEGKPVKRAYVAFISCVVLATTIISDNVGLQYHFGAFILGLSVPAGPPLGSTLVERLDTFISGLLAPLMMTLCALKVDIFLIFDFNYVRLLWNIISIFFVVKLATVFFSALICQMSLRDATALSFIMCAQGIVQISVYDTIFKIQTLDDVSFATGIISTTVMATIIYISVRFVYDYTRTYTGYQKRNILHTANNSELRILVCSQRQDEAVAAVKLLEASNISKESPIAAYALNLVELVGRATPLLINHRLGHKTSSGGPRTQKHIDVFQRFQNRSNGFVNVQVFTSMSLPKFMHDDICSLAFDKLTSIIILPFHRKWNQQGKLIFDNSMMRLVNRQVMDMAPCSVGVLIDRRKIQHVSSNSQSLYHVAVVFLGGDDDREALAYGKRMANSHGVHLTVVRIVAKDDGSDNQWDTVLDTEILKDVKILSTSQSNVVYKEDKAKDGPDTAFIINGMEENFDLIMVGRRHREDLTILSGLSEWNDFPELGPIGDILASSDTKKSVSVLVVQQQTVNIK